MRTVRLNRLGQVVRMFVTSHRVVVVLLAVYSILAISSIRHKSAVYDEHGHLTSGYSYWLTHDYRLDPESGNLPKRWAALPLLAHEFKFPPLDQSAWW